jgi:outer membrane biosynthesis protein TonB
MEWNQRAKLRRYVKISLGLHAGLLVLMVAGKWIPLGKREMFLPSVQIDMVALPDLVKSQDRPPVDTSLPVKEAPPPPPPPAPPEEERMAAPKPPPPAPDKQKELAQRKAAEREAQRALERVRTQLRRDQQETQKRTQQALNERQRDLKRFEETYRAALRGNQLNEGTSASGEMQAAMNAYFGHIREKLQSNWALPVFLQSQGLRAVVRVYIDGRGNIIRYQFTQTSGNDLFDEYVKGAVQRSTPFSPPPEEMSRGLRNAGLEVQFPL